MKSAAGSIDQRHTEAISLYESGCTASAVAAAFGVSEGTIFNWLRSQGKQRRRPETSRRLRLGLPPPPTDLQLVHAHEVEGLSAAEIAKRFQYSRRMTGIRLRQLVDRVNATDPRIKSRPPAAVVNDMHHRLGLSYKEIGSFFHCAASRIERIMKASGFQARPRTQSRPARGRPLTEAQRRQIDAARIAALRSQTSEWQAEQFKQRRRDYPERFALGTAKGLAAQAAKHSLRRVTQPCYWCGEALIRNPHCLSEPRWFCGREHAGLCGSWHSHHPGEPRPVIMERLRALCPIGLPRPDIERAAQKIGGEEREIHALLSERRKKPAVKPEEIGPLGEALLKAARKAS